MNRRRCLLLALASVASMSGAANAQPAPARIVLVSSGTPPAPPATAAAFHAALLAAGLAEGKDYTFEILWAEGRYDRFPALVDTALKRKPAIVMVDTIASARAAQQATKTVPVLMTSVNDPVGNGLVASLQRPGGNVTGLGTMNDDRIGKLVELIREANPKARRIAVLINPLNASNRTIFQILERSAGRLGIATDSFEASAPDQLDDALAAIAKSRPDALVTGFDSALGAQRAHIVEFALARNIPVASTTAAFAPAGALITYGVTDANWSSVKLADYVRKILSGTPPGELPVQLPTNFELVVNTRSAKAMGLKLPQSLLVRADRLIE